MVKITTLGKTSLILSNLTFQNGVNFKCFNWKTATQNI